MSVRGQFGYKNIIPNDSFSLVINCKSPTISPFDKRILLINKSIASSSGPYLAIETTSQHAQLRYKQSYNPTSNVITFNLADNQLNHIILDYDGINTVRIYKLAGGYESITFDLSFSDDPGPTSDNYLWLYEGPGVSGSVPSGILPDIFYVAIFDDPMDDNTKDLLFKGVHPLNLFHKINNLVFFREYPFSSSSDYITSIGSAVSVGTPGTNSNGYGSAQYDSTYLIANQDRGIKYRIGHELIFNDKLRYLLNDVIIISHDLTFLTEATAPRDLTYLWEDILDITFVWDLVDKYLVINDVLLFGQDITVPYERTLEINSTFFFEEILKSWDGSISTSLTFNTVVLSNCQLFNIDNDFTLLNTDILMNIDMLGWADTCYFIETFGYEYDNQTRDSNNHMIQIVEEIIMQKDITRPINNIVLIHIECQVYKFNQQSLENFHA